MNAMLSRRQLLGATAATPLLARPAVVRAETKDLVVGGAAGMSGYMKEFVFPVIEKQLGIHVVFDGTRSLVNLEKLRADRAGPRMSVVLMDDPVMQIAWDDGLIAKLNPSAVPNLGKIKPVAVHLDGAWANYQQPWAGIAYNTKAMPAGVASYAALWDPASKGKVIVPSLQEHRGALDAAGGRAPGDRQAVQGSAV
jgi:putative spermidine/putrescine transport system substrate-binding protein